MYRGKHEKTEKGIAKYNKSGILLASLLLILVLGIGTSLAYIIADSDEVKNEFIPSWVSCVINETFDGTLKEDVTVTSTSDIDAYIRAEVVVNWVNGDGKIVPAVSGCVADIQYAEGTGWEEGSDGYFYYTDKVSPSETTGILLSEASFTAPDGYFLQVEIIADTIQANPDYVVEDMWKVVSVNSDDSLTVS